MIDFKFNYPFAELPKEFFNYGVNGIFSNNINFPQHSIYANEKEIANEWVKAEKSMQSVTFCNGSNHSLISIIIATCLTNNNIIVDPLTYGGFVEIAKIFNIHLIPCIIDDSGIDPFEMEKLCYKQNISAIYLMSTIQNPFGFEIPFERKKSIIDVARKYNLLIIDDDAYGFLANDNSINFSKLAPERTFYIYSFSKALHKNVKFSYLVSPICWKKSIDEAVRITSSGVSNIVIHFVTSLIKKGIAFEVINKKRIEANLRQNIAKKMFSNFPSNTHPNSFHFWLRLPNNIDSEEFTETLQKLGVEVTNNKSYCTYFEYKYNGIRLALGNHSDLSIVETGLNIINNYLQKYIQ